MPKTPEAEPLRRVSMHLFESDVEILAYNYGHGWSSVVRGLVRDFVERETKQEKPNGR